MPSSSLSIPVSRLNFVWLCYALALGHVARFVGGMNSATMNRVYLGAAVVAVLAVAGVGGWMMATLGSGGKAIWPAQVEVDATVEPKAVASGSHPLQHLFEQDPVTYFKAAKTAEDRRNAISEFMALGDDNNYAMLRAALDDVDAEVRLFAVESATALEVDQATEVWKKSATSQDSDVREMTWSLSATYPMDKRASIYREALARGPLPAFEEAIEEMTVTPERPLFEMMVTIGTTLPPDRTPRMLQVVQEWLEPGGGEVPKFGSLNEVLKWWETQHENYDEFMLRTDQG